MYIVGLSPLTALVALAATVIVFGLEIGPTGSDSTLSSDSSMSTAAVSRAERILGTTRDIIQSMGWEGLGQSIIGTVAVMAALGLGDLINALFQIPIMAARTIAAIIPGINQAMLLGPAKFVASAWEASIGAFGTGWTGLLGPLQGPFGVAVAIVALWEVAWYLDYVDRDVFGAGIDLMDAIVSSDDTDVADEDE